MKKLHLISFIVIILSFVNTCFSQTKLPTKDSKFFSWEEAKQGKTFNVSFKYLIDSSEIPQERLDTIIMKAVINSKYQLKNTLSFRPIDVIIYGKENEFKLVVEYSGKNGYGVEIIAKSFFEFKNESDGLLKLLFTN